MWGLSLTGESHVVAGLTRDWVIKGPPQDVGDMAGRICLTLLNSIPKKDSHGRLRVMYILSYV